MYIYDRRAGKTRLSFINGSRDAEAVNVQVLDDEQRALVCFHTSASVFDLSLGEELWSQSYPRLVR